MNKELIYKYKAEYFVDTGRDLFSDIFHLASSIEEIEKEIGDIKNKQGKLKFINSCRNKGYSFNDIATYLGKDRSSVSRFYSYHKKK